MNELQKAAIQWATSVFKSGIRESEDIRSAIHILEMTLHQQSEQELKNSVGSNVCVSNKN
ncbi:MULTISPECIES: hypothetical protein [Lactococcus]|uniref:hypothetical protein n=1 Tax=Lactococcus TaxID=1357 RepID=UPI0013FD97EF|nr:MULTISPECIES: hypothetical protein [Lactococcus]NHI69001.1 hypothetical protein [Lactococcus garvieae]NHI71353.1 hypothetical protein [Lactococcus petauri]NHJ07559.1 hypothetical protein [Lactococcus garvieae]